jgi:hypothetical protein
MHEETSERKPPAPEGEKQNSSDRDGDEASNDGGERISGDPSGKPTVDEPTGPALEPEPDEFDKQADDQAGG